MRFREENEVTQLLPEAAPRSAYNTNDRPIAPRIQKPALPTLDQIKADISTSIKTLEQAKVTYNEQNKNLDKHFAPLRKAEARVRELEQLLEQARAERDELKTVGSPKDQLTKSAIEHERNVFGFSRNIIARLTEDAALRTFGVRSDRLSKAVLRDLQLQFRDVFHKYDNFPSLHKLTNPLAEQILAAIDKTINALNTILNNLN